MKPVTRYVWEEDHTSYTNGGFLYTTDSDEGEQYVSRDDYDELLFEYNNLKNVMEALLANPKPKEILWTDQRVDDILSPI